MILKWSPPENNGSSSVSQYKIFGGAASGSETLLATVNGTQLNYTDNQVTVGSSYYYYVEAFEQNSYSVGTEVESHSSLFRRYIGHHQRIFPLFSGLVVNLNGKVSTVKGGTSVEGLDMSSSYSPNNGQNWYILPTTVSSSSGQFSTKWIPTATGVYGIMATSDGNELYPATSTMFNLAVNEYSNNDVFTVPMELHLFQPGVQFDDQGPDLHGEQGSMELKVTPR